MLGRRTRPHRHRFFDELHFPDPDQAAAQPEGVEVTISAKSFCVVCGEDATVRITMGSHVARELQRRAVEAPAVQAGS